MLYYDNGEFDYAEPMTVECLQKQIECLGEASADVASTACTLACIYDEMGKHEESEVLLQKCLSIRLKQFVGDNAVLSSKTIGADDHNLKILEIYNNLAVLYYHQRKYDQSRELLSHCVRRGAEILGGHSHYLVRLWKKNLDEVYLLKIADSNKNKMSMSNKTSMVSK